MSYQQNQGVYDPNQLGGAGYPVGAGMNGMGGMMAGDMPPPPPEDGENGAGMQGIGYQPPAPPDDSEDPFGLPPPPESLLSNLVFEEPDSPANIVRDPQNPQNLKAGSFAKILEHLTHPTVHDSNFLYDFVLTYRSFAAPEEVLEALIRRYDTAPEAVKRAVGLRVFNVIKHWIEKAYHDFDKDAALPERCMDFLDRCVSSNDPLKGVASGIKTNLMKKKSGEEATVTKASTNPPPTLLGPRDTALSNLMDLNAEEIARQLTMIEWDIWVKIQPWECLGLSWTKKNKETAAPNVLALINRFNVVSGWVATTICTLESVKKRTKAIGKFLDISGHLMSMGNVNGVMEVVSGLGRGAVFRLKQTWEGLTSQQKKTYEEVKKLTDRSLSYANLRQAVRKVNPPCIPYLGMYLTDLTFIEEGNKDFLNNLINWNKRHLISETIRQIKQYQQTAYSFTPVAWLQTNLNNTPVFNEDELYELSEWLEVRMGKERGPKPAILIKAQEAQERAAAAYTASLNPTASAPTSSGASSMGTISKNSAMANQFKASMADSVPLEPGHNWPFYEPDSPQNIDVDTLANTVRSGTITKILERLTHNSVNPDSNALYGFLIVYRSFSNANDILDLLIQRWNVPPPKDRNNMTNYQDLMLKPIQLRVFNFVKTWLDRHFASDFEHNAELKAKLKNFVNGPVKETNEGFAKVLTTTIAKQESSGANPPPNMNEAPQPLLPPAHITNPTFLDLNPEEFARQLTLIHHKIFVSVRCDELLDQTYRSLEKDTKAKHVVALQSLFHFLFTFTKNELVSAEQSGNAGLVATRLLEVAARLNAHRNLFGSRAIIEGVDHVTRTKASILDNVTVDAKNTFAELKDSLIVKANTRISFATPMVVALQPFFNEISSAEMGLGQPSASDKRINFEKRLVVADTLVRLMNYQKSSYAFHEVALYTQWFVNFKVVSPQALAMIAGTHTGPVGGGPLPQSGSISGSPSSSFIPRLSNANSSDPAVPPSTYNFFMMDLVLHDDEIKHEIQDIATEVYKLNLALIQDEIRQLTSGTKAPGTKLLFPQLPGPKAAMPVYVPPAAANNPALGTPIVPFGAALNQSGQIMAPSPSHPNQYPAVGITATSPSMVGMMPPLGSTPPGSSSYGAPGSSSYGAPGSGLLPPANFGNPALAKMPVGMVHSGSNPALSNPALSGNPALMNPALIGSNPALVGSNPALVGSNPALVGSNPALVNSNPALINSNPALGNPALTSSNPGLVNPALANPALSAPGFVASNSNPALAPSPVTTPATNPSPPQTHPPVQPQSPANPPVQDTPPVVRPVPPGVGGKLPAGMKFPLPAGPNGSPMRGSMSGGGLNGSPGLRNSNPGASTPGTPSTPGASNNPATANRTPGQPQGASIPVSIMPGTTPPALPSNPPTRALSNASMQKSPSGNTLAMPAVPPPSVSPGPPPSVSPGPPPTSTTPDRKSVV